MGDPRDLRYEMLTRPPWGSQPTIEQYPRYQDRYPDVIGRDTPSLQPSPLGNNLIDILAGLIWDGATGLQSAEDQFVGNTFMSGLEGLQGSGALDAAQAAGLVHMLGGGTPVQATETAQPVPTTPDFDPAQFEPDFQWPEKNRQTQDYRTSVVDDTALPATPESPTPDDWMYPPQSPMSGHEMRMGDFALEQNQMMDMIRQQIGMLGERSPYPELQQPSISPLAAGLAGLGDVLWAAGRGIYDRPSLGFSQRVQDQATRERDLGFQRDVAAHEGDERSRMAEAQANLGLSMGELSDSRSREAAELSEQNRMDRLIAEEASRWARAELDSDTAIAVARIRAAASGRGGLRGEPHAKLLSIADNITRLNHGLTAEQLEALVTAAETGDIQTVMVFNDLAHTNNRALGETPKDRGDLSAAQRDAMWFLEKLSPEAQANLGITEGMTTKEKVDILVPMFSQGADRRPIDYDQLP